MDGLASAGRADELELHLAGCADCRLAAERLEHAWAALALLDEPGPAPDDWRAIEAAMQARRPAWLPGWLQTGFAPTRAVAVAILLAMAAAGGAVGLALGRTLPSSRSVPLEGQLVAEAMGDLPWSSPASGLATVLHAGLSPVEEGR
jgi:anti-sigma factor RsiW